MTIFRYMEKAERVDTILGETVKVKEMVIKEAGTTRTIQVKVVLTQKEDSKEKADTARKEKEKEKVVAKEKEVM